MITKIVSPSTLFLSLILSLGLVTGCTGSQSKQDKGSNEPTTTSDKEELRGEMGQEVQELFDVFFQFINECYHNHNFYQMLIDRDPTLEKYFANDIEIRRLYSPGAFLKIYDRDANFGLLDGNFEEIAPVPEYTIQELSADSSICEVDLTDPLLFYYRFTEELPSYVTNLDPIENEQVTFPYPITERRLAVLYAPHTYGGPESFYFLKVNGEWKLVLIEDSLCSA